LECFAEMGELSWQSTVRKLHTACWSDEWTFVRRETLQLINQGLCAMLSSLPTPPRATSIWVLWPRPSMSEHELVIGRGACTELRTPRTPHRRQGVELFG
jgi:hypothetical protein